MESRVLALVVVLGVVSVAGAAGVAATDVGAVGIDEGRSGVAAPGADLGTAAHGDADQLRSELAVAALETRLDRADADAERRAAVEAAVGRLQTRLDRYRTDRQRAGAEFAAGDRSADSLALALARVDGDATRLRAERAAIQALAATRSDLSLSNGLESELSSRSQIEGEALSLEGPVRERVRTDAVSGERTAVVLAASEDGVAASTIESGSYRREVTRWNDYVPSGTNQFRESNGGPVSAAYDLAKSEYYATAYQMAIESGSNNPSILTYGGSIYRVTFPFDGGRVRAFVDGNTTAPFRELQRRSVADLDERTVATHEGDDLTVTVNETDAGGPVAIDVTADGDPVDAAVTIENTTIGQTGSDGRRWVVDPAGKTRVTVRATGDRTVEFALGGASRDTASESQGVADPTATLSS
ncbi:DUF7096 domain-containing protein [Halococcoides cellulosivorans]|uniref:Uncharacterized protein n=1 Tax=Halococcoides cellulosivorans TaxID=1679096 RepID=A0A2R4X365_9EURY|nr:hypothetical protein [Halococcoides cellulosivorans]AWB28246.1 hypothetical protein HARCEL1_11310 [Halococcoides cellulosivorans]